MPETHGLILNNIGVIECAFGTKWDLKEPGDAAMTEAVNHLHQNTIAARSINLEAGRH
jgi:hypothetical protein